MSELPNGSRFIVLTRHSSRWGGLSSVDHDQRLGDTESGKLGGDPIGNLDRGQRADLHAMDRAGGGNTDVARQTVFKPAAQTFGVEATVERAGLQKDTGCPSDLGDRSLRRPRRLPLCLRRLGDAGLRRARVDGSHLDQGRAFADR